VTVRRAPDLRLVPSAVGAWLAAAWAPLLAPPVSAALAGVALVTAGLVGWRGDPAAQGTRRSGPAAHARWRGGGGRGAGRPGGTHGLPGGAAWRRGLAGMLLGAAVAVALVGVQAVRRDAAVRALDGHGPVTVTATVEGDPRARRAAAGPGGGYALPVRLDGTPGTPGGARAVVLGTGPRWAVLLPGQRLRVAGRPLRAGHGDLTAVLIVADGPPHPLGRPPWPQVAAGRLRAGLRAACAGLPDDVAGLVPGLVVGDTGRMQPRVTDSFRAAGMTHLLAVSGSNVALVLGLVLLLARWARAGPRLAGALCVLALVGFVILVRPTPSVVRAAAMGAVGVTALVTGRSRAGVPALAASVLILIAFDPTLARDAGFALSVAATAGLLVIAPGWRDALRRRGVPAGLAEALAVAAAAQAACAPVIAAIAGSVSLAAVPANLLAAPAVAPATVFGVAAAVASPFWPSAASFAAWLAGWPARWLILVADGSATTPYASLPWPAGWSGALLLLLAYIPAVAALRRPASRRLVAVLATAALVGALPVRLVTWSWPPPGWRVVMCDVGQGDALVLSSAPGQAVVVDTGPEPDAVDRCLRDLGVRVVPVLVVTHLHADHVGGIAGVFRGRRVGLLLCSPLAEPQSGWRVLAAAAGRTPVLAPPRGWRAVAGAVTLRVLGPVSLLRGTRSDPNDNSLVLRAEVGGVRILLPGDAEVDEQDALLAASAPGDLRVDVLKVAHHGSGYQQPRLLTGTGAVVALVSVGAGNSYGHPSTAVLAMLRGTGARILRTDRDGAVAVVGSGAGLAVVRRGRPP
jgi:competence protein ComEC